MAPNITQITTIQAADSALNIAEEGVKTKSDYPKIVYFYSTFFPNHLAPELGNLFPVKPASFAPIPHMCNQQAQVNDSMTDRTTQKKSKRATTSAPGLRLIHDSDRTTKQADKKQLPPKTPSSKSAFAGMLNKVADQVDREFEFILKL